MIKQITPKEYGYIKRYIKKDIGRNYFILLGLTGDNDVYDKVYGEFQDEKLKAALFRRKTGTLQFFASGDFNVKAFVDLISTLEYNTLIAPKSYCNCFLDRGIFSTFHDGAYISRLCKESKLHGVESDYNIYPIEVEDLDQVVNLYKKVFTSFSSKQVMKNKIIKNRGRGVCIKNCEEIISVAQTDFETLDAAIIVGVATEPKYQNQGLATISLKVLTNQLLKENKDIYLQYDNLKAGKIYERLGFERIDQIMHYKK